jgi:hypothetical protein
MRAEEIGDLSLLFATVGGCHCQFFKFGRFCLDVDSIETEKDQAASQRRSFIAINKRVIARDVKRVRGGHLKEILVEPFAAKGGTKRSASSVSEALKCNTIFGVNLCKLFAQFLLSLLVSYRSDDQYVAIGSNLELGRFGIDLEKL